MGVAASPARVRAHPLHTTLTNISFDPARQNERAIVRVFMDDLGKAVAAHARARLPEDITYGDALRYVASSFAISGPDQRPLPLSFCGVRRSGDLVWFCVETAVPTVAAKPSLTLRDNLLCDLFSDQVNIVQTSSDHQTLLYTCGDGYKVIDR